MRVIAVLLLPVIAALGACATPSSDSACEIASVPAGAVFGVRSGQDTATFPAQIPRGHTGCQRVWYGERKNPQGMQVLATYYFDNGRVRRLVGRVPAGATYDCQYRDGTLDTALSKNPGQCPQASEVP